MLLLAASFRAGIVGSLGSRGSGTRLLGPPLRSGAGGVCSSQRIRCLASDAGWSRRPFAEGVTSELETLAQATLPLWPSAPPVTGATSHAHCARTWASQDQWHTNDISSSTRESTLDVKLSCMGTPTKQATSFVSPRSGPLNSLLKSSGSSIGVDVAGIVTGLSFDKKGVILRQGEVFFVEKILTADLGVWELGLASSLADRRLLNIDHRTNPGRGKTLSTYSDVFLSEVLDGLSLTGERAALEPAQSVQYGTGSYIVYHGGWTGYSGVNENSSIAHIHRTVSEDIRLLWTYELANVPNLAAGEQRLLRDSSGSGGDDDTSDAHDGDQQYERKKKPKGPPKEGHNGEALAVDGAKGASSGM